MHVRKTWKNATVMVLVVAAVATATAALYFNYATSDCCAFPRPSSSLPSGQQSDAAVPGRARFSSTVLHASKMYTVCKTRGDYYMHAGRVRKNDIDTKRRARKCVPPAQ